nr:hypothetical protein [Klebsiella pneumoniae subsp. pneumoniae]
MEPPSIRGRLSAVFTSTVASSTEKRCIFARTEHADRHPGSGKSSILEAVRYALDIPRGRRRRIPSTRMN